MEQYETVRNQFHATQSPLYSNINGLYHDMTLSSSFIIILQLTVMPLKCEPAGALRPLPLRSVQHQ